MRPRLIIWFFDYHRRPTVERMNAFAPQHSRLFKEVLNFFFWNTPSLTCSLSNPDDPCR